MDKKYVLSHQAGLFQPFDIPRVLAHSSHAYVCADALGPQVAGEGAQHGGKVHQTAAPSAIAAAKRLFEKKLIDQPDGGYLTSLGRDAAEQAQTLLTILTTASTKEAA